MELDIGLTGEPRAPTMSLNARGVPVARTGDKRVELGKDEAEVA
jgi:hypothetical protein